MDPTARLERALRNRPRGRDATIGGLVGSLETQIRRNADRLGAAAEAWVDLAPKELLDSTAVEGFRGGVLDIAVESTAAKFRIDRALREGLEARLRDRLATLRKVRVRACGPSR
ncbi:MAG: DciA family protein [Phycisphaerales bacterium]|jgi:hypothetical protein